MKKELKAYKKISFFFSFTIHAIILVLLIEGNKKKIFPKTSMIEVELKSYYENTKEMPKIDNSDTLESIDKKVFCDESVNLDDMAKQPGVHQESKYKSATKNKLFYEFKAFLLSFRVPVFQKVLSRKL